MAIKKNATLSQQEDAIKYIAETYDTYKDLMADRMNDYLEIYKEYSTFKLKKNNARDTTFKVNKMHEVVNKTLPRIMSKSPKWLVSVKPDMLNEAVNIKTDKERQSKISMLNTNAEILQSYLTNVFDKYNLTEPARLRAKNMLIYGSALAKVDFGYEIARKTVEEVVNVKEMDEDGQEVENETVKEKGYQDYVYGEYPTINPISWSDVLYDPRYRLFRQIPAFIEYTSGVRLGQLKQNKDKYINLDQLDAICCINTSGMSIDGFKQSILSLSGLNIDIKNIGVDKNSLTLKTFYGRYSLKGDSDEKLYKITTVNDVLVICMEEISQIPYEQIRAFEDTETNFAWGICEPIIGLQQELNFKKNSASTYINNSLNRSWLRSPNSGINPKDLISKPNGIIPTTKTVEDAQRNLVELPLREINPSYFNEQNDFERQIQAVTFTVDTSNPKTQNSLTNTATGARIKFFESNSVIDELRKHFEEGLTNLGYKLIEATFDNLDNNIIIKKQGSEDFRDVNKEVFRDAISKYEFKIESASSSYDNIEDRRDDAIALFNMGLQAMKAGVPVDLTEMFKNTLDQFERKQTNRFIKNPQLDQMLGMSQLMGGQPLTAPQAGPGGPAQLVEQVAQGGITTAMG